MISAMEIKVAPEQEPSFVLFNLGCFSDRVVLIPSNKPLLLHVTQNGFQEWKESADKGKQVYLEPGETLTLEVQLEPLEN
jgi:hypothetical protein